jgi:signal peptidase I
MEKKELAKRILVGKSVRTTMIRIGIIGLVLVLIFKFVFVPVRVNGNSMDPTYRTGKFMFINRMKFAFREPERGDIVAVKMAGSSVMLLKRVIGLPGELMELKDGRLHINSQLLKEAYIKPGGLWNRKDDLGPDEYYVAGDNRSMDISGHLQGKAYRSQILGGPF